MMFSPAERGCLHLVVLLTTSPESGGGKSSGSQVLLRVSPLNLALSSFMISEEITMTGVVVWGASLSIVVGVVPDLKFLTGLFSIDTRRFADTPWERIFTLPKESHTSFPFGRC